MAPIWSKMAPGWHDMALRWRKMAPRWPQDGPTWRQDGFQMAPRSSKMAQDGPEIATRSFKMAQHDAKMLQLQRPSPRRLARPHRCSISRQATSGATPAPRWPHAHSQSQQKRRALARWPHACSRSQLLVGRPLVLQSWLLVGPRSFSSLAARALAAGSFLESAPRGPLAP